MHLMLIPDYWVYAAMFYLSFMGVVCSRRRIYLDPIHFLLFIPQGLMYVFFDIFSVPVVVRAPYVRLSLALVPALFAAILTLSYWRNLRKWTI